MVVQRAINDIWICKDPSCAGQCDSQIDLCQYMIAGAAAAAATAADVVYTNDAGVTWATAAANPFAAVEDIESVVCFQKDKTTVRWMVVRGAATPGPNPVEIAYSDDSGATWTNVDVEAADTRFANDAGALFALDSKHIWLVTTEGYIFFSSDMGVSWTNQDGAGVTAEDYNAIHFADKDNGFAVADAGIVAKTDDGGETWSAATPITAVPNVLCVKAFDKDNVIVGDAQGEIWRSWDAGVSWTQVHTGTDAINDIDFADEFVGTAIADDELLRTRNGGEDWETLSGTPTVVEFNAIVACDWNTFYAVGEITAAVGVVVKAA